jgi:ArsR family transcriptional regulator
VATQIPLKVLDDAMSERVRGCCAPVARPLPQRRAGDMAFVFKALADPTRVQMLHMLKAATAPICVCDFTNAFDCGQPTVSHHLVKLRDAGFVRSTRAGIWTFHQLREDMPENAREALALIP